MMRWPSNESRRVVSVSITISRMVGRRARQTSTGVLYGQSFRIEGVLVNSRLAIGVLILGLGWTPAQTPEEGPPVRLAQQTVTPIPPPPGLPSIIPQTQAFTACVMNCDTASGACQGACSVSNSPAQTSAVGAHEALTQCYLSCSSQQLVCKQGCPSPH